MIYTNNVLSTTAEFPVATHQGKKINCISKASFNRILDNHLCLELVVRTMAMNKLTHW